MNEFLNFLLNILVVYALLKVAAFVFERYVVFRLLKEVRKEMDTMSVEPAENILTLDVQRVGDQYLCYDLMTNDFVCQGKNIAELSENFRVRYPKMQASLSSTDEETIAALSKEPEVIKTLNL